MITAIMPAYNEESRIAATIGAVQPFADEIVVVDDGSSDGTATVAARAGAVVVRQANAGYIAAIRRGFQEAQGDIVVTIDADGEFPADSIPALVAPILAGQADLVQGRRNVIPRSSERFLNWLANRKAPVGDTGTGLRALRTDLARQLEIRGACICGVLSLEAAARGARIQEIPITLRSVDKPRRIAWFHLRQFFYLLPWLLRRT
jgi:glycosyltransferase involved in cell wall biosynthesis